MSIAETILLRSAIADLREAVVAYGKLASYVSRYPQYGWMELDASHSILFSRIEALRAEVNAHVPAGCTVQTVAREFAAVERAAKKAFIAY